MANLLSSTTPAAQFRREQQQEDEEEAAQCRQQAKKYSNNKDTRDNSSSRGAPAGDNSSSRSAPAGNTGANVEVPSDNSSSQGVTASQLVDKISNMDANEEMQLSAKQCFKDFVNKVEVSISEAEEIISVDGKLTLLSVILFVMGSDEGCKHASALQRWLLHPFSCELMEKKLAPQVTAEGKLYKM